ncbi:1126_t:CDS:1, partial [Funneliformis mosseae]
MFTFTKMQKNRARKILINFDKIFSSADIRNFIDELELVDERREFHLTMHQNVISANTLQALEVSFNTNLGIKYCNSLNENFIRNIAQPGEKLKIYVIPDVDEAVISVQDNEKGTQEMF